MHQWITYSILSLLLTGCGGKGRAGPISNTATANDFTGGSFVDIDIDVGIEAESLDELDLAELRRTTVDCGDLIKLEPSSMLGQLTDPESRCLHGALREAERQTAKDKISRVLLTDAWAKGDEHRWEGIARRHLEVIERSDPDMCYKFAYYLASRSPDRMDEAMKWAQIALDNRNRWEGDLHVTRVYALHKLMTRAAVKKWSWLENEHVRTPSEASMTAAAEARNEAKTVAREWLDYARRSGMDETAALQMCETTSGTIDFCSPGIEELGEL